ncbi:MAG: M14 family zinc carboxypeptidase [Candidatus Krumholzibacteria bacterium]|nr:M14 family zinc carboxypeptidase [Candidatus Krumholzibacteria bacterium]
MKTSLIAAALVLSALVQGTSPGASAQAVAETPAEYFGFTPGDDGKLMDYGQLVGYLRMLDEASPRVELREIGRSPLGRTMYIAFISSESNISRLDDLREINRRLALDPAIGDRERAGLIDGAPVFFLATLSMHSTEVAPSQAAPLIAWDLATSGDPQVLRWLDDVVYMMVPNHNPDGMDMIVEHYRKYAGTKYDGSTMPGLYHKYVGHDNNRDFVILSQSDTKAISAVQSTVWYPQVMVEKHQMGSTGVRYYVPPNHDPIAENIDAVIWTWMGIFGSNMLKDMTAAGLAGVTQHYLFDEYWPGSTGTSNWKNVISFLTEGASANIASPVFIEPNELHVSGKGLAEYKKSINMPHPWPGGWWRLGDLVQYEIVSTMSIIKTCSNHRGDILRVRNDLCRGEVDRGRSEPPFYYVMPVVQRDPSEAAGIVDLLIEHGALVHRLTGPVKIDGRVFEAGDVVVTLAQPFRPFVKEVMEPQAFPERHYTPGGELIKPYDVASWSLPLHRGVVAHEIRTRSAELEASLEPLGAGSQYRRDDPSGVVVASIFPAESNESFLAAFHAAGRGLGVFRMRGPAAAGGKTWTTGGFVVPGDPSGDTRIAELLSGLRVTPDFIEDAGDLEAVLRGCSPVRVPRIGLVETWFHDMDAGWTRFIFDRYGIPFTLLRPTDFAGTDLAAKFDVLVFPDSDKEILMTGRRKRGDDYYPSSYPPAYDGGIGKQGVERLMRFVDAGGTVVAWGRSTELFEGTLAIPRGKDETEDFDLPFSTMGERLRQGGFYSPGSLLRVKLLEGHPLTLGMGTEAGVVVRGGAAFGTSPPRFDMDRRVIAVFPEKEILMSGYIEKEELIANRTAMVWMRKGKGQFVFCSFNPQFRAQTAGTFKLVFNALLLDPLKE